MSKYQWIKTVATVASTLVFSVTIASADTVTTTTTANPYTYADPASTATNPTYASVGQAVQENSNSLTLTNQQLGLGGPVSVSAGYSANYGYELQASFSHMMGFYDAISLLGAYAPQENRIDITWAHAWTEKNRTKLSVERLEEAMDFDYDSGTTTQWVPQYSYGAGYQYLFNKNWLRNVELSGYYAQAQSQDLSTVRFESDGLTYDNYRHIAGATSKGSEATLNVSPWKTGLVGLGLNYDSVNYDTKYEDTDAENSKGLGFTLSLEQLLSKHVKFNLEGSQREVYDDYIAGVSFLTPSNLEVGLNGERTLGENGSSSDSRFNMSLAYFLDDHNRYLNGYTLEDASQSDLASWASKSPAYMDEVLAAADQKTVLVANSSPTPSQSTLQSADNSPVITLAVGEINQIDISDYIESASLTSTQKQSTPTIAGGPSDVEFTYDSNTKSLITKTEVPASTMGKEFAPLVLVFPSDATTTSTLTKESIRDALADKLTFKIAVADSNTPTLNPDFLTQWTAVQTHAKTFVFYAENITDPKNPQTSSLDTAIMFINPNTSYTTLAMANNYPQKVSGTDVNSCYSTPVFSSSAQTLTITSKASTNCPDNVTYKVKTKAGSNLSPEQTITIVANPVTYPYIIGGALPSNFADSASYSYAFPNTGDTGPMISAGEGQTFSTATLKVYNSKGGCTDVTSASNLEVTGTGTNQLTLKTKTGTVMPTSLVGATLKMYVSGTNSQNVSYDNSNGAAATCGGDAFTASVDGPPVVPGNLNMNTPNQPTVDSSYSYDFVANGMTSGSSNFASGTATTKVVNSDNSETAVPVADLGLTLNVAPTSVTMTGIPTATYAGSLIHVYLNVTNTQGSSGSNTEAEYFTIAANTTETPAVGTGTLASANVTETYPGDTLTGTTPGTNRSYKNVNTSSDTGTYVKIVDINGNDVTSSFNVTLVPNSQTLSLQTNGSAVSSSLAGQYYAYVHVYNDANVAASNCSDTACTNLVGATGSPYLLTVNTAPVFNDPQLGSATVAVPYAGYDYVAQGGLTAGSTDFVVADSSVKMYVRNSDGSNGAEVTDTLGITSTITTTDVTLAGTANTGFAGDSINVVVSLKNTAGLSATNTSVLTIAENTDNIPVVNAGQMTAGTQYTTYSTFAFPTTGSGTTPVVNAGANGETFDEDATTAVVKDPAGNDQTSLFTLSYGTDASNNNAAQLSISSGTNTLATQGTWTVALHVVNKDGQFTDVTDTFVVNPNATYVPQANDLSSVFTPTIQGSDYEYVYGTDATTSPMLAGPDGSGETFDTTLTTVNVVDAGNNNAAVPGFSLEFSADKTAITKLKAAASAIESVKGPLNVTYTAYNKDYNAENVVGQPVSANAANTIATDAISLTATSLPDATVGAAYTDYSFATSGGLTLGTTGMSNDDAATNPSSATFSDPDAGFTARVQNNDVIVSGTPVAGHSGTLTLTLNLKTPDGLLTKTSTVTLLVNASSPSVISGELNPVTLGGTYSQTFANTGTTGPMVSAGAGEYFDEDPVNGTTFSVTGSVSGTMTDQFHLVYSNSDSVANSNTAINNGNNQITLVSNGTLSQAETLTVNFHVVNVDAKNADASPGTITVGSEPAYLYCPLGTSSEVTNRSSTAHASSYDNSAMTGTALESVTFTRQSYMGGGALQLSSASVSNNVLICNYNVTGVPGAPSYVITSPASPALTSLQPTGSGWNGTSCSTDINNPSTAATSCQVTYTYSG